MELVRYNNEEYAALMHQYIEHPKDQRRYNNEGIYGLLSFLGIYHSDFYLCKVDDDIVGCIRVLNKRTICLKKSLWISNVLVFPEFRGLGYSKFMMTQALSNCNDTVRLFVDVTNTPAINLYKKMGFVIDHQENKDYIMRYEKI